MVLSLKVFTGLSAVLLLFVSSVEAQNPDSLFKIYNDTAKPDTVRLKNISDLTRYYLSFDLDSAEFYSRKGLLFAESSGQKIWEARILNSLGLSFFYRGNYPRSTEYYFKSLKIREQIRDKAGAAASLNNIGGVYGYMNDYGRALDYYMRALKMAEEAGTKYVIANTLGNIGNIYFELPDTACTRLKISQSQKNLRSMEYNLKSMQVAEQTGDKKSVAVTLGNIGSIYGGMADSICRYFNITPGQKYSRALEFHNKSLKLKEELKEKQGIPITLSNIGSLYYRIKQYPKALEYLLKSLTLARETGDIDTEKDIHFVLYKTHKEMGNNNKALKSHEEYILLRDSIFREDNQKEITRKELQYEYEKKAAADSIKNTQEKRVQHAQISARDSKLKQERSLRYNTIAISVLFIFVVGLIFNLRRLNQQKKSLGEKQLLLNRINRHQKELLNATINGQEEERKRIATELHDGLGGLLSTVKLNLDIYSNKLVREQDKENLQQSVSMLDDVCSDLRTISHNMMPGVLVKLGLISAVKDFIRKVNSSGNLKIQLESHAVDERLDEQTEIALFRVIQEAVNNMIKHSEALKASVQFIGHEETFTVMIEDNGKGFDQEKAKLKQGLGLKSMESRISFLGGKITVDTQPAKGTCLIIELPYKNHTRANDGN